jgi:hypothetical protein
VERAVAAGAEAQAAQEALPVREERAPPHLLRLRPVRRRVQPLVRRRHRRGPPPATPALPPRAGLLAASRLCRGRRARGAEPSGELFPGRPGGRERPRTLGLAGTGGCACRGGVVRVGAAAAGLAPAAVQEHVLDEHPPPGPARRGRGRRRGGRGGGRGGARRGGDRRRGLLPRGAGGRYEIRRGDQRIDQLEPRGRAAERGHGPRAAVHGRAPRREVAAPRRGAAPAAAVLVVVAAGVEIRERGQGERPDLAVVEELVGGDHGPAGPAELELRVARAPAPARAGGRGGRGRRREEEVVDGAGRRAEEVSAAAAAEGRGTAGAGRRAGERGGAGAVDVVVHGVGARGRCVARAACSSRRVDLAAVKWRWRVVGGGRRMLERGGEGRGEVINGGRGEWSGPGARHTDGFGRGDGTQGWSATRPSGLAGSGLLTAGELRLLGRRAVLSEEGAAAAEILARHFRRNCLAKFARYSVRS